MNALQGREIEGDLTTAEWSRVMARPLSKRAWASDEEAAEIAQISIRGLQLLQTVGLIRSVKASREIGGFRRVWRTDAVAFASVAGEAVRLLNWPVQKAGKVLSMVRLPEPLRSKLPVDEIILDSLHGGREDYDLYLPDNSLIKTEPNDWFLVIYDAAFVFVKVSPETAKMRGVSGCEYPVCRLIGDDTIKIFYDVESDEGARKFAARLGQEQVDTMRNDIRLIRHASRNARATIQMNLSMPIRAAHRRLSGHPVEYSDEIATKQMVSTFEYKVDE